MTENTYKTMLIINNQNNKVSWIKQKKIVENALLYIYTDSRVGMHGFAGSFLKAIK